MERGFPRWVEDELWNWSRWCWLGDWPHPNPNVRCASAERNYVAPTEEDEVDEDDEPRPTPVHHDNARRVQAVYERLVLVEQRVVQAEYPRRHEYAGLTASQRITQACDYLGISSIYYRIALGNMKEQVRRAFK
ncbi:hypothetical protein AVE30378_02159 [Achromobacter veterisilvae]|uniref:Uncharacterized protein n=1 Tax=Achromobacter veterisilvae TaxID=2069367 RepID=A0A446CFG4_9BURK|nr:hypothetical protein [Achromobacter veterisilvae]SSW66620.1 hypothetical protein AVE30378_02159 [Achromobacter veterisilvae]